MLSKDGSLEVVAVIGKVTKNKDDFYRCGRLVVDIMKKLNKSNTLILSGGSASGAEWWVKRKCKEMGFRYMETGAQWYNPDGSPDKSACFKRNKHIADLCTRMIAVWDGKSRGTAKAIEWAKWYKKPVEIVNL